MENYDGLDIIFVYTSAFLLNEPKVSSQELTFIDLCLDS